MPDSSRIELFRIVSTTAKQYKVTSNKYRIIYTILLFCGNNKPSFVCHDCDLIFIKKIKTLNLVFARQKRMVFLIRFSVTFKLISDCCLHSNLRWLHTVCHYYYD